MLGDAGQRVALVEQQPRFSSARRLAGIGTSMRDFRRSVVVGRVAHDRPHDAIARECFRYGHTLALLPMNGQQASVVVTLPVYLGTNAIVSLFTDERVPAKWIRRGVLRVAEHAPGLSQLIKTVVTRQLTGGGLSARARDALAPSAGVGDPAAGLPTSRLSTRAQDALAPSPATAPSAVDGAMRGLSAATR